MKQFVLLVLAAVLGSALTAFALRYWNDSPAPAAPLPASVRLVNQSPTAATAPAPGFDFKEAARRATPAVVHISTLGNRRGGFNLFLDEEEESPFRRDGAGSGVIYSADGYIITNNHVVENAVEVEVTLHDNRRFTAQVIGKDRNSDLAVIKIDAKELPTLDIANSDQAEIGEWVLAIGNPLDLTSTVTAGIISAKGRSLQLLDRDAIEAFIQTDAAVNPGNSGGALVDTQGRLIGINTAIATRTGLFQGYSFAIPVNLVIRIADDIIAYGSYRRAFLGVEIYPLDAEAAGRLGVKFSQGVVIDRLVDGGSAQMAGLQPDDVITRVNDRAVRDVPDLTELVGRAKVGETLQLTIWRNGREVEIPVEMRGEQ